MLLGEALLLRGELQRRQFSLDSRIRQNLVVKEGEEPSEDPQKLLSQCRAEREELARLIAGIHLTNAATYIITEQGQVTITQATAHRGHLQSRVALLRESAENAIPTIERNMRGDVRYLPLLEAQTLRREVNMLSRDLRKVTAAIQQADWSVPIKSYTPSSLVSDLIDP